MHVPQENPVTTAPATAPVADTGSRLLTTAEQETFEALSLEVFGASSRWSTILKKGLAQPVMDTVTEYVPATDTTPEETKTVQVPIYLDQAKKSLKMARRWFSPESLLAYMQERKKQIDAIKAMIAKAQAEQKAKKEAEELAAHVAKNVSGSAK